MILGSSKDPVLIKKIYLRIWTLRDEVEAVVKARVDAGETENISVEDLIQEYQSKSLTNNDGSVTLEVLNGGKDDEDSSSEEPEATEETESAEETEAESENESETEAEGESEEAPSDGEAETEAEAETEEAEEAVAADGPVDVIQRRPDIPAEKIYNGTTVLTEMNMEEMYFFSNKSFLEGQSIVIEFMVPTRFVVNANVFYSRPYNHKSRIIRDNNLIYRVAVRFSFLKPGERTLLRKFVASIEPDLSKAAKPKAAPKPKSEGFDDLDDLDL